MDNSAVAYFLGHPAVYWL